MVGVAAQDAEVLGARSSSRRAKLDKVDKVEAQYPQAAKALALDVTDGDQVDFRTEVLSRRFEQVDVLVNNAGYGVAGAAKRSRSRSYADVETNVFGLLR